MFQSANKSLNFFLDGISCIRLQYSVVFWRKLINCSMSLTSEMRGIAPRTSGLLSRRSNIWPTSHVYQISRKLFSLSQQLWSFFSFAENWDYLQIVLPFDEWLQFWRCRASIPVPLECKARALPFELHHHSSDLSRKLLFQSPNRRLKIFWEGISCIRFQCSVVFWRKLIKNSMSLTLEMRGIAPRTSGLISGRSTIWPTSHVYQISRNFFSLSQQLCSFSLRSQKIYLLGISICNRLSGDSDYHLMSHSRFGDAGHRSPYLSHAKRSLYHLSYIPIV